MANPRLIIVDGYSLLFRAFYGTRYLSTADGRPTNALHGFLSMIFALIERVRPTALLVALDAHGPTFRHEAFPEYKGTRREVPAELIAQFPVARELLLALGIPHLELPGFEADDIIGTVSRQAESNGYDTTIISGDFDGAQLVDDHVTLVTPKTGDPLGVAYDPAGVLERFQVPPAKVPDWKAIVGDTSDNIPGVPGIGPKGAATLLAQFDSIEDIIARLNEVDEKLRKKIEGNVDQLRASKHLATIRCDAPLSYDFAPFRLQPEQLVTARAILESYELKNVLRRLELVLGPYLDGNANDGVTESPAVAVVAEVLAPLIGESVLTLDALLRWLDSRPFSLVEAPAAPPANMFDEPAVASVMVAVGDEVRETTPEAARALFGDDPSQARVADAKPWFNRIPPTTTAVDFDATLAGYVLQSGRSQYDIRSLVSGYLDVAPPETPAQVAVALERLARVMGDRLRLESQEEVYRGMELPLTAILSTMERAGITVSQDFLREFSKSLEITIDEITRRIHDLAGEKFLIGSPKQLGEILFVKLGLPTGKKTKTGFSTGVEVLQELAVDHEIVADVLSWRELTKLKSTYADALPKLIKEDGRIHTTFNQTVAATGRLSSIEPNLQNIPIRTMLGRQIRRAFVAPAGTELLSLDYSQIELRILAHLCRDEALVDAFERRIDVHTATAAVMFHVAESEVNKEQRRLAKMLNFAVLYGVTPFGLQQQLGPGFSVQDASRLIKQYNERFASVASYTEGVVVDARSKGFTVTILGRRRYFPEIHASNRTEREYAERQAKNAPIQGAAADMIKAAMIQLARRTDLGDTRMLLQVHDELLFEVPLGQTAAMAERIRETMEDAMPLSVPVEVEAKAGANWEEMAPIALR